MPQKSKLKLAPLDLGPETIGQRIARFRKEKGYTQTELANKMGLLQALISEYERDKLRPYYEMVARFALALEVTSDELLGIKSTKSRGEEPDFKIMKRVKKIKQLSEYQQKMILKNIDMFIKGAQK